MKFKDSYIGYVMMYVCYYCSLALFTVLLAVYLTEKGFSSVDIALVVSSGLITSLVFQPVVGHLSDRIPIKILNTLLLLASAIGSIFFQLAQQLPVVLVMYSVVYALINSVNPSIEKMATMSRFRYGDIRIWGTIGFAVGAQLAGVIHTNIGAHYVYLLYPIMLLCCLIGLHSTVEKKGVRKYLSPDDVLMQEQESSPLKNMTYVFYLCVVFMFYGIFNVSGTHIPAMLVQNGIDVQLASTIVSISVLCELPFVYFSYLFMDRLSSKTLLRMILCVLTIQMALYAFIPVAWAKVVATLAGKHTIGMIFIMTNLKIIRTIIPQRYQVSALSFVAMAGSFSAIVLQNVTGVIIVQHGYETGYMLLFGCAVLALLASLFLHIKDDRSLRMFD